MGSHAVIHLFCCAVYPTKAHGLFNEIYIPESVLINRATPFHDYPAFLFTLYTTFNNKYLQYFTQKISTTFGFWLITQGDAGAVALDTPVKMLDRLLNEVINHVSMWTKIKRISLTRSPYPNGRKAKSTAGSPHCWSRLPRINTDTCNSWTNT